MARRVIGREQFLFGDKAGKNDLDGLDSTVDWSFCDQLMAGISASPLGEQGWPPHTACRL